MTFSNTLKKNWLISLLVIIFIVSSLLFLSWIGFITFFSGESFSTLYLYELNGSVVPQGNIFSLTEKDFSVFPKLAPVIHDKNQKPVTVLENGNRLYTISLTNEEYNKFIDLYVPSGTGSFEYFFEYKGKYYYYRYPSIH